MPPTSCGGIGAPPYDLVVYQLGNAACHDYMWGYLFRYPGLVVLHDAQVHQARAQSLLGGWTPRRDDYHARVRRQPSRRARRPRAC